MSLKEVIFVILLLFAFLNDFRARDKEMMVQR